MSKTNTNQDAAREAGQPAVLCRSYCMHIYRAEELIGALNADGKTRSFVGPEIPVDAPPVDFQPGDTLLVTSQLIPLSDDELATCPVIFAARSIDGLDTTWRDELAAITSFDSCGCTMTLSENRIGLPVRVMGREQMFDTSPTQQGSIVHYRKPLRMTDGRFVRADQQWRIFYEALIPELYRV